MVEALLERLRRGDRNALARLLTLVARGAQLDEIARGLAAPARPARVVAITGSGGVGKSTLLGKLLPVVRGQGLSAAVLACDPQSPLSGGALLGDRFRMGSSIDEGIFIRSVATLGGRGAVAEHVELMIRLLETFGFDVVFLETVGAGQGDVAVSGLADIVALLVQPESGDELQWEKAGILELADIVVLHKADLPGAAQTFAQLEAALGLTPERQVPIVRVSSQAGTGFEELWQALAARPRRRAGSSAAGELLRMAHDEVTRAWQRAERSSEPRFRDLLEAWQAGKVTTSAAVSSLLQYVLTREGQPGNGDAAEDRTRLTTQAVDGAGKA